MFIGAALKGAALFNYCPTQIACSSSVLNDKRMAAAQFSAWPTAPGEATGRQSLSDHFDIDGVGFAVADV
jgi:hypothetical protein